jgi:hypothetical protein
VHPGTRGLGAAKFTSRRVVIIVAGQPIALPRLESPWLLLVLPRPRSAVHDFLELRETEVMGPVVAEVPLLQFQGSFSHDIPV